MNLTLVIKGTFSLCPGEAVKCAPKLLDVVGDVLSDGEGEQTIKYPSDFVPFKPLADVLLVGSAHAPKGRPVTELNASLRVGGWRKNVQVTGDRVWQWRLLPWSGPTAPIAFKSMPLGYERAYGGRKFRRNPAGLGDDKKRLPNVESPTRLIRRRGDQPFPASFGAVAANWEPRRSKVGTYKGNWLKERWPWFPDDFNWSYFNAAPEDQQVEGYLRGDEELEFQNLHAKHSLYRSKLPGLRARAFVQVLVPDALPEFREVKLNLDTLWIDMDAEKLVLVWRGITPVRTVKFKEVTHIAVFTEPMTSLPQDLAAVREWIHRRLKEETGEGPPTPEEIAKAAAARTAREAEKAKSAKERAELEKEFAELEQTAGSGVEQAAMDRMIADGLDPKVFEVVPPSDGMDDVKTKLALEVARMMKEHPELAAQLGEAGSELSEFEKMEQEVAAHDAKEIPAPNRESVQAAVSQGKVQRGVDLSGLNLSGLNLSGADFSGADFSRTNLSGANLAGSLLARVDFRGANLSGADMSRAVLDEARFSEAKLEGATFREASVRDAVFSKLELVGMDFSGCKGEHPNFSKCNLEGAKFSGAKLPQADFSRSCLTGASFVGAEMTAADFKGVSAVGIDMERADITNLRAGGKTDFTGGRFREVKSPKSIWQGAILDQADFSRANLTGALFEDASLTEARFDRAELSKASFEDASAHRALLTNANLLRASFNRADLTEASLEGSNLYEASFWETQFVRTNLKDANLKRTLIAQA